MCEVRKKGGGDGNTVYVCMSVWCVGREEWGGDEGKSGVVRISFTSLKVGG